jgi:hypothetical protein
MVEFEGQLTLEDVMKGFRLNSRTVWHRLMPIGLWVLIASTAFLYFQNDFAVPGWLIGFIAAASLIALLQLALVPFIARRTFRQQEALYAPFRAAADQTGLRCASATDISHRNWNSFRYWKEGDAVFVLAESSAAIRVIPKRLLTASDAASRLRQLLLTHLGKAA